MNHQPANRPAWPRPMPRHGTRPPLAWRWRRARLSSAWRLDGTRRPDRLAPHHGQHLAACRVVDHRNQGIDQHQPQAVPPWGWWSSERGGGRARCQNQKSPSRCMLAAAGCVFHDWDTEPLPGCGRVGFADELHWRLAEPSLEHRGKRAGAVVAQIQRHLRDGLPGRQPGQRRQQAGLLPPCPKTHTRLLVKEAREGAQALVQSLRPCLGRGLDAGRLQECLAQPCKLAVLGIGANRGIVCAWRTSCSSSCASAPSRPSSSYSAGMSAEASSNWCSRGK